MVDNNSSVIAMTTKLRNLSLEKKEMLVGPEDVSSQVMYFILSLAINIFLNVNKFIHISKNINQ